jgi:drug/metabolite transporter (DMT)-like permease
VVYVFGFLSAVLLAVGFVVQQHVASLTPDEERLSPRLLLDLLHRPLWLLGIVSMVAGQIVEALALRQGALTVVEALTATNVLFALPMAAAWRRRRLCRRDWVGAAGIVVGLAAFVVAADPGPARSAVVPLASWVIAGLAVVVAAGVLIALGVRRAAFTQATMFGLGAGVLFGLQDALTQRVLHVPLTVEHFFGSWVPYSLVAVGAAGLLVAQSAYQAAPLKASLPAINIAEPVTGIGIGAGLFDQGLRVTPVPLTFELLGIVCMMTGLLLVARSDLVSGKRSHHPLRKPGARGEPGVPPEPGVPSGGVPLGPGNRLGGPERRRRAPQWHQAPASGAAPRRSER